MENIIDFNQAQKKLEITEEDIFDMFLFYSQNLPPLMEIDLECLMKSLGKYKDIKRFHRIYSKLDIKEDMVNLNTSYIENKKKKTIVELPNKKYTFMVIAKNKKLEEVKNSYSKELLCLFDSLMFNVIKDLEYGLDGWQLISEDEYIKDGVYPGFVTNEFIGKKKTKKVKEQIRKRAIQNLKREYE